MLSASALDNRSQIEKFNWLSAETFFVFYLFDEFSTAKAAEVGFVVNQTVSMAYDIRENFWNRENIIHSRFWKCPDEVLGSAISLDKVTR